MVGAEDPSGDGLSDRHRSPLLLVSGQDTFLDRGLLSVAARPSLVGSASISESAPAPASGPQGPGEGTRGIGSLASWCCALQVGGLCGVPGRGTQDSGDGPGAARDGESRPESSTFSGDEDEKGDGLDVKPRLLEPVKSSWSKADSSGGPKRLLDSGSSEASGFSVQLLRGADRGLCGFPEVSPRTDKALSFCPIRP